MKNFWQTAVWIAVGIIIIGALVHLSGLRGQALQAQSDCVVATAQAQGYSGNVYGQEAWALFASSCK